MIQPISNTHQVSSSEPGHRRIIRTARTVEDINVAARSGLRPLVKPVIPHPDVHFNMAVFQSQATGEIHSCSDVRAWSDDDDLVVHVAYYPYRFPNPFAAYLVPADIAPGEEVWLEDLIEDLVAVRGSQEGNPRLPAAPAIWNGEDFIVLFMPDNDAPHWLG